METIAARPKNEMNVMDETGDTKILWDADRPDEVENARETFEKFKKKKYLIYRTKSDGSKGEIMREFDPHAERIIISPPVVGG